MALAKSDPPTAPTMQPAIAISPPSSKSMRRTRLTGMPTASRVPVSRVRFSIVNWKSSEMSITAAAMRKKLKLMNSWPKSMALSTEIEACARAA